PYAITDVDVVVRLHLDDKHTQVGRDHDEVRFALGILDVVRNTQRVQDQPIVGVGALRESPEQSLLPWRRVMREVRGHHSSHWAPPAGKGTGVCGRRTISVNGARASTLATIMPRNPSR